MRAQPVSISRSRSFAFAPVATSVVLTTLALLGLLARPLVASVSGTEPVVGAAAPPRPNPPAPAAALPPVVVPVDGEVVAVGFDQVAVQEAGGERPVAFNLDAATTIVRDGAAASASDLRPGDRVELGVDGRTGQALTIVASPEGMGAPSGLAAALAALGLAAAAFLLRSRRPAPKAPVVRRPLTYRPRPQSATRLLPAPVPAAERHDQRPAA